MRIGVESRIYGGLHDYDEVFAKIKAHGYDCVDYGEFCSIENGLYSYSEAELESFLRKVGSSAKTHGLTINQLHAYWPMEEDSQEGYERTVACLVKAIKGAKYLDCPFVVIHPYPFMLGWFGMEVGDEKIWQYNLRLLRTLIPYAEEYGVVLCVENLPFKTLAISRVREVKRLVQEINHPRVKVCLDTGHAYVLGDNVPEIIRFLGDDLVALHVHDNNGKTDDHLAPYQGNIEWQEVVCALREIGYTGCFSMEVHTARAIPEKYYEEMRIALGRMACALAK